MITSVQIFLCQNRFFIIDRSLWYFIHIFFSRSFRYSNAKGDTTMTSFEIMIGFLLFIGITLAIGKYEYRKKQSEVG